MTSCCGSVVRFLTMLPHTRWLASSGAEIVNAMSPHAVFRAGKKNPPIAWGATPGQRPVGSSSWCGAMA
jgi:hypothetical protein